MIITQFFIDDWKERYVKGTCTLSQLQRLVNIGRLSQSHIEEMIEEKRIFDEAERLEEEKMEIERQQFPREGVN